MSSGLQSRADSSEVPIAREIARMLIGSADLGAVVLSKFGCNAALNPADQVWSSPSSSRPALVPEKRFSARLGRGSMLSVWKDDLTAHRVEAVVNAANEDLDHCGGLALALSIAGGPEIQHASNYLIQLNGKVRTGDAVITQAGQLPCKAIIHAVGPRCSPYPSQTELDRAAPLLKKAICSILDIVKREKLKSVAIPALSSGIFNFPLPLCAEVLVKTLKEYLEDEIHLGDVDVRLVNNDEPSVRAMEGACRQFLRPDRSYSQAVRSPANPQATGSLQLGRVTLHIKKGSIENEKAGVIVNTTSASLDLNIGEISKAILEKAGKQLQQEVKRQKYSASPGDVIRTRGFRLDCDYVYHAVCADKYENRASEILGQVVRRCLEMATKNYMKSISFPAIGTGNLMFPKDEVARIMVNEATSFAQIHNGNPIDVYFVLFPADKATYKAFDREMKAVKESSKHSRSSHSSLNDTYEERQGATAAGDRGPSVTVFGGSPEGKLEALAWLSKTLIPRPECVVRNNHIYYFGQKEHEDLLCFQAIHEVTIQETLRDGKASLCITGQPLNVLAARLAVERLCCNVQEEYAVSEESEMLQALVRWRCDAIPELAAPEHNAHMERAYLTANNENLPYTVNGHEIEVSFKMMQVRDHAGNRCVLERKCQINVDYAQGLKGSNTLFYKKKPEDISRSNKAVKLFESAGLQIIKLEKIDNPILEQHFRLKMNHLSDKTQTLYQRVPAQFCDLVCRVGFQRLYSEPDDRKFGDGIYFSSRLETLADWRTCSEPEKFIYIFQAQVLTGRQTSGSPGLIVPPARTSDPLSLFDSVTGGTSTHVVFNSHQAYPEYLVTCRKIRATRI
ncbi:protein mono-ADP-ribosyltransferase PARP9 [Lepisosteus oculatus]|uniref:protein mono-ADP-ribosyltransferase PARP9 n=1 Tax=Lepisosteus oculatus TaxID=7918 RepID=UPI0035F51C49